MPKNVMRETQFKVLEELVQNPQWEAQLQGKSAREFYKDLPENEQNILSFLVHFAAFLSDEDLTNPSHQPLIMEEDARRKGGESGARLLEISQRVVGAIGVLQNRGIAGRWAYVPQAGGEITYGLDAAGGDWTIEDLRGRRGFKGMQAGTTPRNVAKKEAQLVDFYGEYMKGNNKVVGLFPTTDQFGALRGEEELADNIADGLSRTRIVVGT